MKLIEVERASWHGSQIFNPKFENMTLKEIEKNSNIINEWFPFGYNLFLFVRSERTLYAYNEVK